MSTTLRWSTLVNFGLHVKTSAVSQLHTSASVAVGVPQEPRSLFGLSRSRRDVPESSSQPTSGRCSSTTDEPISVGFEASGSECR